jgi:hypothetical protein
MDLIINEQPTFFDSPEPSNRKNSLTCDCVGVPSDYLLDSLVDCTNCAIFANYFMFLGYAFWMI